MSSILLLMLAGCGRYWSDTAELELGQLSLEAGTVRLEESSYRPDWQTLLELRGEATVEGMAAEQEWNQLHVLLEWVPSVEDQGVRAYGVSLWNLDDTSGEDPLLLSGSAVLDAVQADASAAGVTVQLEGALEGAGAPEEDGGGTVRFALGLMVEDISGRPTEPPPLAGPASLIVTANGLNNGSDAAQPTLTVRLE